MSDEKKGTIKKEDAVEMSQDGDAVRLVGFTTADKVKDPIKTDEFVTAASMRVPAFTLRTKPSGLSYRGDAIKPGELWWDPKRKEWYREPLLTGKTEQEVLTHDQ
jgi:hypothetical protein